MQGMQRMQPNGEENTQRPGSTSSSAFILHPSCISPHPSCPERLIQAEHNISAGKLMQRSQHTRRGELVHRAGIPSASSERRAIEVAVAALDQTSERAAPVRKLGERRQRASRRDLENRAGVAAAAVTGRALKVPVAALDQRAARMGAVCGRRALACKARVEREQNQRKHAGNQMQGQSHDQSLHQAEELRLTRHI